MRKAVYSLLILVIVGLSSALSAELPTCESLGIEVKKTVLRGEAKLDDTQLIYASADNNVVFVRTEAGEVFRSRDEGDTWEKQTTNQKMPGIENSSTKIQQIIVSAYDTFTKKSTVYFLSSNKLWISDNAGDSYFFASNAPTGIRRILPHPYQQSTALGLLSNQVWLTQDSGRTWKKIFDKQFTQIAWGFPKDHQNRIYAATVTNDGVRPSQQLILTDDFFTTTTVLRQNVWWFTLRNEDDIIVAEYVSGGSMLSLSDDAGKTWRQAAFPSQVDIPVLGWHLFDSSADAIFIALVRDYAPLWADVYKSNSYGKDFTQSLRYLRYPDFTRFHSIDGIYVANQFQVDEGALPSQDSDVKTKISFNKGATWQDLRPPQTEFDGTPYNCSLEHGCALHLHGYSAGSFSWFYSTPKALGIMFANGNVGTRLSNHHDDINAYFSMDAGVNWEEVGDGPYVPEFGNNGGIIVAVDEDDPVNFIMYHVGEMSNGKTVWKKCKFNEEAERIRNIRISPKYDSKQFIMYGIASDGVTPVIYSIEFAHILQPCQWDQYEEWTPQDAHGGCVLGQHVTYRRRKPGASCWYNLRDDQIVVRVENCSCTPSDWECDYCYEYDPVLSACVLACTRDPSRIPEPPKDACKKPTDAYFAVDQGWRKVADDTCDESLPGSFKKPKGLIPCSILAPDVSPPPKSNTDEPTSSNSAVVVVIVILVLIVAIAAVFYVVITRNDRVRAFLGLNPIVPEAPYSRLVTSVQDEDDENENVDEELGKESNE